MKGHPTRRNIMSADNGVKKLKFNLGRWFSWQGSIAPGKGNAGGNVHLELPKGSGLVAALVCLSLAIGIVWMPITAWFGAGVLVVFAAYHARRWWRERTSGRLATPRPARAVLAGVCSRLAER